MRHYTASVRLSHYSGQRWFEIVSMTVSAPNAPAALALIHRRLYRAYPHAGVVVRSLRCLVGVAR